MFSKKDKHHNHDNKNARNGGGSDQAFVREAAMANLAEIELGRCALRNASSPQVRAYGQRMITDHTAAQSDLKNVGRSSGNHVPDTLDSHHRGMLDKLCGLNGAEFDRQYTEMMQGDHTKVVGKFEDAERTASSNDVRSFASRMLPTLRSHLDEARRLGNR